MYGGEVNHLPRQLRSPNYNYTNYTIIGKHIDNVNPGGEERFKLSSRAPRYYDLFPADFVNFFYVTHDELSERVTTCSLVTSL